jgi:hypothetical protein
VAIGIRLNLPLSSIFPRLPWEGVFLVASCFPTYELALLLACMSVVDS